jgi:DNA primase
VIDFVARLRGTGFRETAAALSQGVPAPPPNVRRLRPRRQSPALGSEDRALIDAAVACYERTLTAFPDVRAYLAQRGVSLETARSLRLGYAARGLAAHLREAGFDLAAAERLGLLTEGRERFAGRIVIPDLDTEGGATWLTGRALLPGRTRYLGLNVPAPLLGLARVRAIGGSAVVVVEGPFDWLTACEWGFSAVALAGTHANRQALKELHRFSRVYLALDADAPGRRAAQALAAELGERATVVRLPDGDLNDLGAREDGREMFLAALAEARARRERTWRTSKRDRLARAA